MDARKLLLDMARGTRSGYWVEVLHGADGSAAYMLHFPYANGADWRDMPALPSTWDALRLQVARHIGDANEADRLPKYDEQRTFTHGVIGCDDMAALMKWANITRQAV